MTRGRSERNWRGVIHSCNDCRLAPTDGSLKILLHGYLIPLVTFLTYYYIC